ncbi:MAG: hypothetical protein KTR24_04435 [Saprospiraceae bacterium]|nr:hypothetical protein [Saprospiraceae bacterium]
MRKSFKVVGLLLLLALSVASIVYLQSGDLGQAVGLSSAFSTPDVEMSRQFVEVLKKVVLATFH